MIDLAVDGGVGLSQAIELEGRDPARRGELALDAAGRTHLDRDTLCELACDGGLAAADVPCDRDPHLGFSRTGYLVRHRRAGRGSWLRLAASRPKERMIVRPARARGRRKTQRRAPCRDRPPRLAEAGAPPDRAPAQTRAP